MGYMGDPITIYPKPYSIHLRGTFGSGPLRAQGLGFRVKGRSYKAHQVNVHQHIPHGHSRKT